MSLSQILPSAAALLFAASTPRHQLQVTLLDYDGKPLPHAKLKLETWIHSEPKSTWVRTDKNGRISMTGRSAYTQASVWMNGAYVGTGYLMPGESNVTLSAPKAGLIEGLLLDQDGKPLPNWPIELWQNASWFHSWSAKSHRELDLPNWAQLGVHTTDSTGHFHLRGNLENSQVAMQARKDGYFTAGSTSKGQQRELIFRLDRQASPVAVRLYEGDNPLSKAIYHGVGKERIVSADKDGVFRLTTESNCYLESLDHKFISPDLLNPAPESGASVQMIPPSHVAGQLKGDFRSSSGWQATFMGGFAQKQLTVKADGTFSGEVWPGTFFVAIHDKAGYSATITCQAVGGQEVKAEFEIPAKKVYECSIVGGRASTWPEMNEIRPNVFRGFLRQPPVVSGAGQLEVKDNKPILPNQPNIVRLGPVSWQTVLVTTEGGIPIKGAHVSWSDKSMGFMPSFGFMESAQTDASGKAIFSARDFSKSNFYVEAAGYEPQMLPELPKTVSVKAAIRQFGGRLVDSVTLKPVAGFEVYAQLNSATVAATRTGLDGRFNLTALPEKAAIFAQGAEIAADNADTSVLQVFPKTEPPLNSRWTRFDPSGIIWSGPLDFKLIHTILFCSIYPENSRERIAALSSAERDRTAIVIDGDLGRDGLRDWRTQTGWQGIVGVLETKTASSIGVNKLPAKMALLNGTIQSLEGRDD